MTSYWDRPDAQPALRARHEDRLGWSIVRCRHCALDAVCRLILVWDGRVEQARTMPYCRKHMDAALDEWNRICDEWPAAVEGLSLNVGTAW